MASAPLEIASTIQAASIDRHPCPHQSANPSTSADKKVIIEPVTHSQDSSSLPSSPSAIPLQPHRRSRHVELPPLPDLRFEQSYLRSIPDGASLGTIGWITFRDQVFMPLLQGTLWTLGLAWWRHWNRGAKMAGQGIGSRFRRWWWRVNDWKLPDNSLTASYAKANKVREFYEAQLGASVGD